VDAINGSWARPYVLALTALFSLAAVVSSKNFTFNAISNRIVTPNVAGKNNFFAVSFFNPQFSQVDGKIYDLKGHLVSSMTPALSPICPSVPTLQCLMWDGTSNGPIVSGGVYIYVIESGSEVYDGTVVVIR
jgi:hypothetical protein